MTLQNYKYVSIKVCKHFASINVDYRNGEPVVCVYVDGQINKCLFYVNDATDNTGKQLLLMFHNATVLGKCI